MLKFNNFESSYKSFGGIKLFGNLKVLLVSAIFISLSIVLGKQLSFTFGAIRISFENLTILMAGIMFGPIIGLIVGAASDLIGCLVVGYTICPLVTVGAATIGLISGIVSFYFFDGRPKLKIAASVSSAHIIGSLIIKSTGLYLFFGYPLAMILIRIPTYIVIGTIEGYLIYALITNKAFCRQLQKIQGR